MSKEQLQKSTHQGDVIINDIEIKSYVLENGDRVLSRIGLLKAIGRTGKAKGGRKYDQEFELPVFLTANNLKPFIDSDLIRNSSSINFVDLNGNNAIGYKAEILASICYVFIDAMEADALLPNQIHIAERCKILVRGFATIGIIALVDEATGYQYDREKDALQIVLKAYINDELLKWQQKFPDAFYFEIFRLNKWDYTVSGIKKRPSVIGTWTNELIYKQLPKGVLEELKNKTPKSESGNYTARFFQSLTPDVGHPALTAQIYKVIGIMSASNSWTEFKSGFNRMVDRKNGQMELNFDAIEQKLEKEVKIDQPKPLSIFSKELKGLLNVPPPQKDKESE